MSGRRANPAAFDASAVLTAAVIADLVAVISDVATMARPHLAPGVELRSHVTIEPIDAYRRRDSNSAHPH